MRLLSMLPALALVLGTAGAGAEPVKIRVAWIAPPDAPLLMFAAPGVARHEGQSYSLEVTHFQGTPPMIPAIAVGEVDIIPVSYNSLVAAVGNAGLKDLRLVADMFQDGKEGYLTNEYMVLKGDPIKAVEDLKGHVYATNVIGAAPETAMRVMLRKHGLDDKKDLTVIEAPFPTMRALLVDRKVDVIMTPPPFSEDPALRGVARTLFTMRDAVGVSQLLALAARAPFLAANRAAVVDYLEDSLRALRWASDRATHDDAVQRIAAVTKAPAAQFQGWIFTRHDYYRDPQGRPSLEAVQSNVDMLDGLGVPNAKIDVRQYADLSLVEEAAGRLK